MTLPRCLLPFFVFQEYAPVVCPQIGTDVLEPLVALCCLCSNDLVNFEDLEQLKVLGAGFPIAIAQVFLFFFFPLFFEDLEQLRVLGAGFPMAIAQVYY